MDIKTFESLSCKEQIHLKGMAGAPNSSDSELAKSTYSYSTPPLT